MSGDVGLRASTRTVRRLIVLVLALVAMACGWAIGKLGAEVPRMRAPAPRWHAVPPPAQLAVAPAPGAPAPRQRVGRLIASRRGAG